MSHLQSKAWSLGIKEEPAGPALTGHPAEAAIKILGITDEKHEGWRPGQEAEWLVSGATPSPGHRKQKERHGGGGHCCQRV